MDILCNFSTQSYKRQSICYIKDSLTDGRMQSKSDIQLFFTETLRKKTKTKLEINRMEKSAHVDLILHHVTG